MPVEPSVILRVRALLASARPAESADSGGLDAANLPRIHVGGAFEPSRRLQTAEIRRIARWYGWDAEISDALVAAGARSLSALDDAALAALLARLQQLETCAQLGLDPPDSPAAR